MKRVENVRLPSTGSTREMRQKLLLGAVMKPAALKADVLLIHRKTHRYFLGYDKIWVWTQEDELVSLSTCFRVNNSHGACL